MSDTLETYRKSWQAKPLLQDIYDDFYERIIQACVPGRTVEIGGGIGMLKRRLPDLITTDIQFAPWLDCVADAQALPIRTETPKSPISPYTIATCSCESTSLR